MEAYEKNRSKYLYQLWNRMASGSYFPPPVREVEIPKGEGKMRKLGIPTINDRIGQMVVKEYLEPRFEKIFSKNSYGYRPGKSAHMALVQARENCRKTNWVIDLDIKGYFDNISHEKLQKALEKHVSEPWCQMYIKRWLTAPVQKSNGEQVTRQGKGTPQGGVISPLLANLYLHYTMDKWLELHYPEVQYERYADDAILHVRNQPQGRRILKSLETRMKSCELELHPEKTKLVYCRDHRRKENYPIVKFDFLGYSFQPRSTMSKQNGRLFLGYDCAISIKSKKRILAKMRELDIPNLSFKSIVGIAQYLEPYIRGWINYYGKFRVSELNPIFQNLRKWLVKWVRKRYKRYKTNLNKAYEWLGRVRKQYPALFYQWRLGFW